MKWRLSALAQTPRGHCRDHRMPESPASCEVSAHTRFIERYSALWSGPHSHTSRRSPYSLLESGLVGQRRSICSSSSRFRWSKWKPMQGLTNHAPQIWHGRGPLLVGASCKLVELANDFCGSGDLDGCNDEDPAACAQDHRLPDSADERCGARYRDAARYAFVTG